MNERQEILSRLSYDKIFRGKISEEFKFNLPKDEQAEQVYHALVKEQQLYLYYAIAVASLSSAFWDFGDSTRRVIHLIKEWESCTLKSDNYESFIYLMDNFTQNEVKTELLVKWRTNFSLLLADPEKLDNDMRNEMLLFLCRINAFHSLRLFFKMHSPVVEVNFPSLLREAIGCLHSQSVQALIEAGANIHDYFCTAAYLDDGIYLFMPVFYYAVWLPCDNRCALHREQSQIVWDNPKLQNMIKILLSFGADPEQNCLAAPGYWNDNSNPQTMEKTETQENAISLARNIISDQNNIRKMNQESLAFLNSIMELKQKIDSINQQEEIEENTSVNERSPFNFCAIS